MKHNATPPSQEVDALKSTALFGTPIEDAGGEECREIAKALWGLLDDIDTASDMFKPSDLNSYKAFYNYARKKAEERGECLESDGYKLYLPIREEES